MGAYSSWPAMVLTHHLLVRVAAFVRIPHSPSYCLLGDDIVIANAAVAQQYEDLLSQLDMPVLERRLTCRKTRLNSLRRRFH
jgi:hypothetical protein